MLRAPIGTWNDAEFETPVVGRDGAVLSRERRSCRQFVLPLRSGVSLALMAIPGGDFEMGSSGNEGYEDERPAHPVSVSAFLLGQHEITQEQWLAVMRQPHPCLYHGAKRPVDRLSWVQAMGFCERLAVLSGYAFRLPTEAEWEYACRAGTTTPFYCGPTITTDLANYVGEHIYLEEPRGIYRHRTTEVGSFPPNAFGLHDMLGNLWEWCADPWHPTYERAPGDGGVWQGGDEHWRVVRGGCWHDPPQVCRCACRLKFPPYEGEDFVGFRVAVSLGPGGTPASAASTPWRRLKRLVSHIRRR